MLTQQLSSSTEKPHHISRKENLRHTLNPCPVHNVHGPSATTCSAQCKADEIRAGLLKPHKSATSNLTSETPKPTARKFSRYLQSKLCLRMDEDWAVETVTFPWDTLLSRQMCCPSDHQHAGTSREVQKASH